jgi:ATP-dependent DNA helicase RecG
VTDVELREKPRRSGPPGSTKGPRAVSWDTPVEGLPGIGPKRALALRELGIETALDLLLVLPERVLDLERAVSLDEIDPASLPSGEAAIVRGRVEKTTTSFFGKRRTVRVTLTGEKANLSLVFPYLAHAARSLEPGTIVIAVGELETSASRTKTSTRATTATMLAPKVIRAASAAVGAPEGGGTRPLVEYPKEVRACVGETTFEDLAKLDGLEALLPRMEEERTPTDPDLTSDDLRAAHRGSPEALVRARARLALAEACARAFLERAEPPNERRAFPELPKAQLAELFAPFVPTPEQSAAIRGIAHDLAGSRPSRRLVLGEVGTGKTLVALAALVQCVTGGGRVLVFTPTSVLAEQWASRLARVEIAGKKLDFVQVRESAKARDAGVVQAPVCVGTHALLGARGSLGEVDLVIVDEPQRTGTALRKALFEGSNGSDTRPHVLLLTATPLPRTLALVDDGALVTSVLGSRPEARALPSLEVVGEPALPTVLADLAARVLRGERGLVVVPRVAAAAVKKRAGTSAFLDLSSLSIETVEAQLRTQVEQSAPGARIASLHAGLPDERQRALLEQFRDGSLDVLVGTTLLEVGLDVPEATFLAVLGAERFGIGQLHQLRGRVGRGTIPGRVVLVHGPKATPQAVSRLVALCKASSGEDVARTDLALRGPGDRDGIAQSGVRDVAPMTSLFPSSEARVAFVRSVAESVHRRDPGLLGRDARVFARVVARVRRGLSFEAVG